MIKLQNKLDEPKRSELQASYSNSPFSEYVSCHIFESVDVPVQKTLLGMYDGKVAVVCEDFMQDYPQSYQLQEFRYLENSFMEDVSIGRTPHLETIEAIFRRHPILENIRDEAINRYWDTFIVDAFIGNFDRHSGNWGYIVDLESDDIFLAPVYDCGSSLFPELSDDKVKEVLEDEVSMKDRIYKYPTAALMVNNRKVAYYDFIESGDHRACNEALKRIYPRIDMSNIHKIVDDTPMITEERNALFHRILSDRYEYILTEAYQQLHFSAKTSNYDSSERDDSLASPATYVKAERTKSADLMDIDNDEIER
jgi:hypothetical protein